MGLLLHCCPYGHEGALGDDVCLCYACLLLCKGQLSKEELYNVPLKYLLRYNQISPSSSAMWKSSPL